MGKHKAEKTKSELKPSSIARSSGIVGLATLVSRVLGLIRDMVFALFFGAGLQTDAFFVAFKIPNFLRRLVAEGSLSSAFVPVFTSEKAQSDDAARRAIAGVATFSLTLTTALTCLGMYFAEELTLLFAPGFGADSYRTQLASDLLQLMFPYVMIVSLLALTASVLNTLGKFAVPALAPSVLNICMILGAIIGTKTIENPIYALPVAVIIGGILGLIPQLIIMKRLAFPLRFGKPEFSGATGKLLKLMLPSMFSASLYQIMMFINTLLASLLAAGSISWLFYADRLFQFPLGVFSLALATAILPALSKYAAEKNETRYQHQLTQALRWITFISLPATVGLFILAEDIISLLFERGSFSATDSAQTALALKAYVAGLWAISCQSILIRAYLSRHNAIIPTIVASLSILLNIIFAFTLMGAPLSDATNSLALICIQLQTMLGVLALGHVGLALAGSLASFFALFLLMLLAPKAQVRFTLKDFLKAVLQTTLACIPMAVLLWGIKSLAFNPLWTVLMAIPLACLVFFGVAALLRMEEIKQTTQIFGRFIKNDKNSFPT